MASAAASGSPSQGTSEAIATTDGDNAQTRIQEQTDALPNSTPVEMSQLSNHPPSTTEPTSQTSPTVAGVSEAWTAPTTSSATEPSLSTAPITILPGPGPTANTTPPQTTDTEASLSTSAPAIGSPLDHDPTASTIRLSSNAPRPTDPTSPSPSTSDPGPTVLITLMPISGKRHPFKIDTRYLKRRNVFKEDTENLSPFDISIYTLKELIWRDWREDWEVRPTVPGSIRLIYFGKVLEDKVVLRDIKLFPDQPNILHMSVKPQDIIDEEEHAKLKGGKAGSSRSRTRMGGGTGEDGETSAGCCRCTVM